MLDKFTKAVNDMMPPGTMALALNARNPTLELPRNNTAPPAVNPAPNTRRLKLSMLIFPLWVFPYSKPVRHEFSKFL